MDQRSAELLSSKQRAQKISLMDRAIYQEKPKNQDRRGLCRKVLSYYQASIKLVSSRQKKVFQRGKTHEMKANKIDTKSYLKEAC